MASFDRSYVVARGAYGRSTNEADWLAGKDFRIVGGPYFSIRDLKAMKDEGIILINFVNNEGYTVFYKEI